MEWLGRKKKRNAGGDHREPHNRDGSRPDAIDESAGDRRGGDGAGVRRQQLPSGDALGMGDAHAIGRRSEQRWDDRADGNPHRCEQHRGSNRRNHDDSDEQCRGDGR